MLLHEFCYLLGMNCEEIIPDYLATAISFGYNNMNRISGKRKYLFIDIGYYCCNFTVAEYDHDNVSSKVYFLFSLVFFKS